MAKLTLRRNIRHLVRNLDPGEQVRQSSVVCDLLSANPRFRQSTYVGLFCSMPGKELDTAPILHAAFSAGKRVYVPKVLSERDMVFVDVRDEAEIASFGRSAWNIPEPSAESLSGRDDGLLSGKIELLVCPGVCFDARGHRLGQGRGYYDRWLAEFRARHGRVPHTIGICFSEQVVDVCPVSETDIAMDEICFPPRPHASISAPGLGTVSNVTQAPTNV